MTEHRVNTLKAAFLDMYARDEVRGNVSLCISTLGIARTTFYKWMKEDQEFADKVHELDQIIKDDMEQVLIARAVDKSDTALIYWLKYNHEKYREQPATLIQVNNTVPITDDQLSRIIA